MSHDQWRTPPKLFEVLDQEFHFGLDAAADAHNTLCALYLDMQANALMQPWIPGAVWCNPPYSLLGPFVRRAYEQSQHHHITTVVLMPAYTDPVYWSEYVMRASEVRFLKGRLSFLNEEGHKQTSARYPSVVVVNRWLCGRTSGRAPQQFVWDWRDDP